MQSHGDEEVEHSGGCGAEQRDRVQGLSPVAATPVCLSVLLISIAHDVTGLYRTDLQFLQEKTSNTVHKGWCTRIRNAPYPRTI